MKYFLIALAFLSSCRVGPVYEYPSMEIPCEWEVEQSENRVAAENEFQREAWWENLNDCVLDQLMRSAACQNLDLQIAAIRVLQARSIAEGKKGDLYPHIDGSVNYGHVYYSKDALVNGLLGTVYPVNHHHVRRHVNFYEVGFDADWEIDLFGMTAHEIAAFAAQEQATEEELGSIWVTLSAEIAKNYFELRLAQQRLIIVQKKIDAQNETVKLTQELFERGLVNESEVGKIESELSSLKGQMPLLKLNQIRSMHKISVLLGYTPSELNECLNTVMELPELPREPFIGVPSDLLRRRPDIRKKERELAAATEKVGSAIAALFPRFSLRGFIGDISTQAGSLFSPASATWLAGPQLLIPIFNSRLLLQDVEYNKLSTKEALLNYQKTVLESLEEAENAIASYRLQQERLAQFDHAYSRLSKSLEFANQLYAKGVSDQLTVNSVEQSYLQSKEAALQAQVDLIMSYIALYKALGGSVICN